jgi:hypothetical protein
MSAFKGARVSEVSLPQRLRPVHAQHDGQKFLSQPKLIAVDPIVGLK